MKINMELGLNHRRASSDNAYNRKSIEKDDFLEKREDIARLDRQHQDLLNAIRENVKKESGLTKLERIRVTQWIQKLSAKPNNAIWRKNIIFYLKVLAEMINQAELSPPFTTVPVQTALPNLKLLDLPFPIRQRLAKKQQNIAECFKAISKQGSIQRSKYKAKSINFHEDLTFDLTNIDNSKIKMLNNKRKPSIKSCQASEKRQESNVNVKQLALKLKLTAEHDKQNNHLLINNSCVTRRLFERQTINENTLLTYVNEDVRQPHNTTVCSFEGSDYSKSNKNRGLSLLLKVYDLIHKNAELDEDKQAQKLSTNIARIAEQMGVSLNDSLNQSNISAASVHFRKASENIRLKFVETDEQTLEFMSFLHKFRVKNQ